VSEVQKTCPACRKPTAGYVPCPHCGADPSLRLGIRAAVILCVAALTLGSGYFFLHVSTLGPQPTLIASIDRWMDYAHVWIEGVVTSGPQVGKTSVSFDVQDESGKLGVDVYILPKNLKRANKIPSVGDMVLLFGQLRVYVGKVELRVSSADDFQLTRAQPVETSIRGLIDDWYRDKLLKHKRVTIKGTITDLRPLSSAKLYTLEDNRKNKVKLYVHNGLSNFENVLDLRVLQTIEVTAGVSAFGAELQLALSSYDDIKTVGAWLPADVAIENVDNTLVDNFVRVRGQIVFVEMAGKSGSLEAEKRYIWLKDNDNPPIWMWESVYKLFSEGTRKQLRRGAEVELVGRVSKYDGRLQIDFTGPQEPSPTPDNYDPPLVENVATIDNRLLNDFVRIEGKVVENSEVRRAGLPSDWEFTLRDNLGENVRIWIPNTIYERMPRPVVVGDNVRVVGRVIDGRTVGRRGILVRPGLDSDVVRVS